MKDMDLLVCSDLHGSEEAMNLLKNALEDDPFDAVIICGDFTTDGSTKYVREVIEAVNIPLLAVPGNCDSIAVAALLEEHQTSVHSKRVKLKGTTFYGFGGTPPSPHNMPFEVDEGIMAEKLRNAAVRKGVMITHTPAYGMNDLSMNGVHTGSRAILEIATEYRPRLALSGHMHESRGAEASKGTMFVNPGAARDGNFAKVRLSKSIRVCLCSL